VEKTAKLVIIGDSAFAEVAYEYFQFDSAYEVVGFAVERAFLKTEQLCGLPVIALEDIEARFPPAGHAAFAAVVYTQLNRLRARLAAMAKAKGYKLASYVSPKAFVWRNVKIGEHCFIFENNVIQPFVEIADNVVLWSGNHIGHHSKVQSNAFISSHVVISGFCVIGENSFIGVNTAVANNITIAKDNWIGPGVVISKNTNPGELYRSPDATVAGVSALRFFKVKE
jgi:sugar O-acyltransferase (sialic acid O-acetyltransferase NeuD family)